MTIDLTGCRAKIERAQEHREVLDAEVAPGNKAKRLNVSAKLDPQWGYHVFRVSEIPESWAIRLGVVLGDTVHNLRCALDYLYCHYVRIPTPQQAPGVRFPIESTKKRFSDIRVHVRKIPGRQCTVIRKAQPYYSPYAYPNIALDALRELSNRDKHHTLTPILLRTSTLSLVPALRDCRDFKIKNLRKFLRHSLEVGTEILDIDFPPDVDPEVEVAGYTTARIELPHGGFEIISGVDLMLKTVWGIVDGVEAAVP
jgi:hypothetical protein